METFSELLAPCAGTSSVTGEFLTQTPLTQSFDVSFDQHLNKRLSKQSWGWWFETPSRLLWRHRNEFASAGARQSADAVPISKLDIYRYKFPTKLMIPCDSCRSDEIKRKQFPRYWPFVCGIHRWPVNSPHKGQWRGALMFSLICAGINGLVNHRGAGDLRRHRAHYDSVGSYAPSL